MYEDIYLYTVVHTHMHQLLNINTSGYLRKVIHCPLQRGRTSPNKCPGYDTKQSVSEIWEIQSTPSLPSLPGPLWSGVVASDRILSIG